MSKVDIKIIGVESRKQMVQRTLSVLNLSEDNVIYDDRPGGGPCLYTAMKAWLSPIEEGVTHRVVLADDAYVCNNFEQICNKISTTHPDKLVTLFPFEYQNRSDYADNLTTPYIRTRLVAGVGILMPVKYIKDCFDWIQKVLQYRFTDDTAISLYCADHGIEVITTIPSTIQHIGDESILQPDTPVRRTVYYSDNPVADWECKEIAKSEKASKR